MKSLFVSKYYKASGNVSKVLPIDLFAFHFVQHLTNEVVIVSLFRVHYLQFITPLRGFSKHSYFLPQLKQQLSFLNEGKWVETL